MEKEQLIMVGKAAFGLRWQTDMARALGVTDRTVRSWVAEKYSIPPNLSVDVMAILEERKREIEEAIELMAATTSVLWEYEEYEEGEQEE